MIPIGRQKYTSSSTGRPKSRPADTQDAREAQLISLAYDLAEQHLRDGTATSQEITHFLKLGSSKERVEKEILVLQKDLVKAKTEALQSQKRSEELFANAMAAFKSYAPPNGAEVVDDEELQ